MICKYMRCVKPVSSIYVLSYTILLGSFLPYFYTVVLPRMLVGLPQVLDFDWPKMSVRIGVKYTMVQTDAKKSYGSGRSGEQ